MGFGFMVVNVYFIWLQIKNCTDKGILFIQNEQ